MVYSSGKLEIIWISIRKVKVLYILVLLAYCKKRGRAVCTNVGGHIINKADTDTHTHVYNIKKPHSSMFSLVSIERSLALGMWLISLWFSLTQNQCLSVVLHMKMVFHEKAAHSAHKCFPLRQRSSFALFSVSFQFYWDGSDGQRCGVEGPQHGDLVYTCYETTAVERWKARPPAEMLCLHFSLHHKEHWCVFQGWDLTL